ncbi:MAG: MFS transporter, partial [Pseudomonadota bacterium]
MSKPVAQKMTALAEVVGLSIEQAIELGVPIRGLRGVETYLEQIRSEHPEVEAITVVGEDHETLFRVGDGGALAIALNASDQPIALTADTGGGAESYQLVNRELMSPDGRQGEVRLVVDQRHFQQVMNEVIYDVLVVLVISFLVAKEFLTLIVTRTIVAPFRRLAQALSALTVGKVQTLHARAMVGEFADLAAAIVRAQERTKQRQDTSAPPNRETSGTRSAGVTQKEEISPVLIRVPLFLLMFAEELSRSFLPLYAGEMEQLPFEMDAAIQLGLPITLFMIVVAVATPLAGSLVDRFGVRSILSLGMVPGIIGFFGTAAAHSMSELMFWRAMTAISYAVMFIGAQGFVAKNSPKGGRTKSMAHFVGAVIAAGICGASVGGILADHIGYRQTFIVSAALACVSMIFVLWLLPRDRSHRALRDIKQRTGARQFWRNPHFAALLLFAAIPAKLLLTGYLFFLVPVVLEGVGASSGLTGRVMMIYGLAVLILTPLAARLSDRLARPELIVAAGGIVAGIGPILSFQLSGFEAAIAGVLLLGIGHALGSAPQLAMVAMISSRCGNDDDQLAGVLGFYRLVERSGAIVGPLIAASLVGLVGPEHAAGWLGVLVLGCAVIFALVFIR